MVKCQVESFYKNSYFIGRVVESKQQGIITWKHYSRSYYNLKREVYLGKIIEVEVLKEEKNGILRLSRIDAIKERKKEKISCFKSDLKSKDFKDLYIDEMYGRRIYRDLSKLIPYATDLPVSSALVVGSDKNHIYLELEELDILGVMPVNYINWHRIKDTDSIKSYIGEYIDVKLLGYGDVNILDAGGNYHNVKDGFICSSALNYLPDYNRLSGFEGKEVLATVVASNRTGSILRCDNIPIDLYCDDFKEIGEQVRCKLRNIDVSRNVFDIDCLQERGILYGG